MEKLLKVAKERVSALDVCAVGLPAPQVTVLCSNKGNLYIAENDVTGEICEKLKENEDTEISVMVTMWKGECVDVASHTFRKAIWALDQHNAMTDVILQGRDGYVVKKLNVLRPM